VLLDPRRFFYGFATRKEIEVDCGVASLPAADSDSGIALRKMGKRLDDDILTRTAFRIVGVPAPSAAWSVTVCTYRFDISPNSIEQNRPS
jgi:hypothetical protein